MPSATSVLPKASTPSRITMGDLANLVSDQLELSKEQGMDAVRLVFETITDTVMMGGEVSIRAFGLFKLKHTKARNGANPKVPGERFCIAPTRRVGFRASRSQREMVGVTRKTA